LLAGFLKALKLEILQQKKYLENEVVETVYFGGGTPSVLTKNNLAEIIGFLHQNFSFSPGYEITFEANPDDLTDEYLALLYESGVRRLSIGIQSFNDGLLKKMNRRHNAQHAVEAIKKAAETGFSDISADLIYGLPGLTRKLWKEDLETVFNLPVTHLSAYHLTYHEGTPFNTWLKKGTLKPVTEPTSIAHFEILVKLAAENGFEHYEISNFARNGLYSRHNTSYWTGKKYLGLGPSAHSFNGISRRWNVAHTEKYIRSMEQNQPCFEEEILTENNLFNEYILTRIRTKWGVSATEIQNRFGSEKAAYFQQRMKKYIERKLAVRQADIYTLTTRGWFISDEITTDLMFI
jgi:oxygen-independent coproporphyrinogen-3 oxidase